MNMHIDKIIDVLSEMSDELIVTSDTYNCYGRNDGESIYTVFGDIMITEHHVYITMHPDDIPKDMDITVRGQFVYFKIDNYIKKIKLPCRVSKVIYFNTNNDVVDIKLQRRLTKNA
jgi:hypothetical protein